MNFSTHWSKREPPGLFFALGRSQVNATPVNWSRLSAGECWSRRRKLVIGNLGTGLDFIVSWFFTESGVFNFASAPDLRGWRFYKPPPQSGRSHGSNRPKG